MTGDPPVRADEDAGQVTAVAQVHDVLTGGSQQASRLSGGQERRGPGLGQVPLGPVVFSRRASAG